MNNSANREAGKGSAPRKKRDDDAYSKGWDAIFGGNKKQKLTEEQKHKNKEDKKDALDY